MANFNLEHFKHKLYVDYKTLAIYDLPDSLKSFSDITQQLENLKISYYNVSFVPTNFLVFRNSCHICRINYNDIYNYDFCILLTVANQETNIAVEKIKLFSNKTNVQSICQINLCKDSICPLMIEQQKEMVNLQERLLSIIEEWFSNDQIYKHKDILVSMNNQGWVPLNIIESKFEEMIVIDSKEIVRKLKSSSLLEIDVTDSFVRRIDTNLPFSKEHLQIVLLDIPDVIKSIRQMPGYLQIEGSSVEYFDYSIHSAIVTMPSREDAVKLVDDILHGQKMKAKLLVPCLTDSNPTECNRACRLVDQCQVDVEKILNSLALLQEPTEQVHLMRLQPGDLVHEFQPGFCPPSQAIIDAIVKQCNFYFSDANVLKDLFILKKIKSNPGGWVDLNIVARFKQIVKLSNDCLDNVVYAMCFSYEVQISRDGKCLRRRLPLPEWDPSVYIRSLFLWNLPKSCDSYQKLDQVFCDEGRFVVCVSRFIRANRNVPADLRKLCDKIPALGKHNCGVVEFKTRQSMLSADEFIHMKWESVKTFYLDIKEELPKPAVIVGKPSKFLPPPIPVSTFDDERIADLQAGTRIDPRFWQVARQLSDKKRVEIKIYNNKNVVSPLRNANRDNQSSGFNLVGADFPPLTDSSKREHFCPNRSHPIKSGPNHPKRKPLGAKCNAGTNKCRSSRKENKESLLVSQ